MFTWLLGMMEKVPDFQDTLLLIYLLGSPITLNFS